MKYIKAKQNIYIGLLNQKLFLGRGETITTWYLQRNYIFSVFETDFQQFACREVGLGNWCRWALEKWSIRVELFTKVNTKYILLGWTSLHPRNCLSSQVRQNRMASRAVMNKNCVCNASSKHFALNSLQNETWMTFISTFVWIDSLCESKRLRFRRDIHSHLLRHYKVK